jgi:hypothetical protein
MPLMNRKELAVTNSEMTMIEHRAPAPSRPVASGSLNIRPRSITAGESFVSPTAPEGIDLLLRRR